MFWNGEYLAVLNAMGSTFIFVFRSLNDLGSSVFSLGRIWQTLASRHLSRDVRFS